MSLTASDKQGTIPFLLKRFFSSYACGFPDVHARHDPHNSTILRLKLRSYEATKLRLRLQLTGVAIENEFGFK